MSAEIVFPPPSSWWGSGFFDVSEDDADEDDADTSLTVGFGRICGFTVYAAPPAAFDVEASIPPKQITYGPQRKGRGGKIRKW